MEDRGTRNVTRIAHVWWKNDRGPFPSNQFETLKWQPFYSSNGKVSEF